MAILVKHNFVSTVADNGNTNEVGPNEWNDGHAITMAGGGFVLGRITNGSGAVEELPLSISALGDVGIGGASLGIKLEVYSPSFDVAKFSSLGTNVDARINLDPRGSGAGVVNSTFNSLVFQVQAQEHMRLTNLGRLLMGTAINTAGDAKLTLHSTENVTKLVVTGYGLNQGFGAVFRQSNDIGVTAISFENAGGGQVGSITTNASTTSYNTSSDHRLKENVKPLSDSIDKIRQLKPCSFTWKINKSQGQGFIAHELQEIIPDAVAGEKDAVEENGKPLYQGVDMSKIVPVIVGALQDAIAKIDALKTEFDIYRSSHP